MEALRKTLALPLIVLISSWALPVAAQSPHVQASPAVLPVFPGAEGFGTTTPAGSGRHLSPIRTTVYKVTNLHASGPGSLRECVEASGPRVCVFEVSGTIPINERLWIRDPYITIAGQTAPSPGITLRGATLTIRTHDVLIQHLRIRVGDGSGTSPGSRDGIAIINDEGSYDVHHVVIDHCSVSWAIDGSLDVWGDGIRDVTISHSIISEGLYDSLHPEGPHSTGLLVGPNIDRVSIHRSLLAHNYGRNPRVQSGSKAEIVNNVFYNWGRTGAIFGSGTPGTSYSDVVGNHFTPGADTFNPAVIINDTLEPQSKFYVRGNVGPGRESDAGDDWDIVHGDDDPYRSDTAVLHGGISTVVSAFEAYQSVLSDAGARPADRDAVDKRVVNDVRNGTGHIIDSQDEVGGWPGLRENHRTLTLPGDPNGDHDGDGYTNLEEWLHHFAAEVEGREGVFRLIVDPCFQAIDPGGSATYEIKVEAVGVLTETVKLTVAQPASNLLLNLDGTALGIADRARLTVSGVDSEGEVAEGLWYDFLITGATDAFTYSARASLLVGGTRVYASLIHN